MTAKLLLGALVLANVVTALLVVRDRHEHRQAFVALSKLERDALGLYLYGYSYQQIADHLQITTKSVDNAIQRVKKKLEARLKEME